MNTYTLTEIELQEWAKQILEAAAENACVILPFHPHLNGTKNVWKPSITNTPLPPLPSGAKKEDIHPVEAKGGLIRFFDWLGQNQTDYERMRDGWKERSPQWHSYDLMVREYGKILEKLTPFVDAALKSEWLEELSPSKESQKQSLIELMEDDQRDGMYGVSEIKQELLECYKKAWVAKNSPDYDAERHPHYYGDIDYTAEFNPTVFGELVRELVEDTLLNSEQGVQEDEKNNEKE